MQTTAQIAKHFREVYFGGNWTWSNLKDNLSDVNWKQATTKIQSFNTIAVLTYHIHYFVKAQLQVFKGEMLDAHDEFSFTHPPINNEEDWQNMLNAIWREAEEFIPLIEQLSDEKLEDIFIEKKYGTYYRNLLGLIEHTHYHLGQIALIKKMVIADA